MASRPTRIDVARRAGVAPSTVSLVLNNRAAQVGIAEATQKRIEEAARALGYYPNRQIRAVRSGRTHVLGLYLRADQWGSPTGYWTALKASLERAIAEVDLQLLVHYAPDNCATEEAFARQAGGAVDGVIILHSGRDPIAQRLIETQLPGVEIGDIHSPLPHVAVDGRDGVRQALRHLHARGYAHPVFLNFESNYEANATQRRLAFMETGQELFGSELPTVHVTTASDALARVRETAPECDAVVCASDMLAYAIWSDATRQGIAVPHTLGITGFDCLDTLGPTPPLTSVATPMDEMARQGIAKLRRLIDGEEVEQSTLLPVTLRVGQSTR